MMDGYDFWSPDEQTARRPRFWPWFALGTPFAIFAIGLVILL